MDAETYGSGIEYEWRCLRCGLMVQDDDVDTTPGGWVHRHCGGRCQFVGEDWCEE